jgi:hypothetical protein
MKKHRHAEHPHSHHEQQRPLRRGSVDACCHGMDGVEYHWQHLKFSQYYKLVDGHGQALEFRTLFAAQETLQAMTGGEYATYKGEPFPPDYRIEPVDGNYIIMGEECVINPERTRAVLKEWQQLSHTPGVGSPRTPYGLWKFPEYLEPPAAVVEPAMPVPSPASGRIAG